MVQIAWKWGSVEEAGYLDFLMHHFGIHDIYVIGEQDSWEPHRATLHSISHTSELPAGVPVVVLSSPAALLVPGDVSLHDFVHPTDPNTIYFVGANDGFLAPSDLPVGAPKVFVPTANDYEMHAHTALTCALYDRLVKLG